jgi:hypothetical protein
VKISSLIGSSIGILLCSPVQFVIPAKAGI